MLSKQGFLSREHTFAVREDSHLRMAPGRKEQGITLLSYSFSSSASNDSMKALKLIRTLADNQSLAKHVRILGVQRANKV